MARLQQLKDDMPGNEAGRARNEYLGHRSLPDFSE
jgi:hypothetical protein